MIRLIRRLFCKHPMVELDYYSDCQSVYARGTWEGQGDQCWHWYCTECGTPVYPSYYLEVQDFAKKHGITEGPLPSITRAELKWLVADRGTSGLSVEEKVDHDLKKAASQLGEVSE